MGFLLIYKDHPLLSILKKANFGFIRYYSNLIPLHHPRLRIEFFFMLDHQSALETLRLWDGYRIYWLKIHFFDIPFA